MTAEAYKGYNNRRAGERVCAREECGAVFKANSPRQRFCCYRCTRVAWEAKVKTSATFGGDVTYQKKDQVEKKCARCGDVFTGVRTRRYCGAACAATGKPVPSPMANPIAERRLRKLGDSIPPGLCESLLSGVATHYQRTGSSSGAMPVWTHWEMVFAALLASDRPVTFPVSMPGDWKIGSFEDLREVMDSPEFQRVMEKYELDFTYETVNGVNVVAFSGGIAAAAALSRKRSLGGKKNGRARYQG